MRADSPTRPEPSRSRNGQRRAGGLRGSCSRTPFGGSVPAASAGQRLRLHLQSWPLLRTCDPIYGRAKTPGSDGEPMRLLPGGILEVNHLARVTGSNPVPGHSSLLGGHLSARTVGYAGRIGKKFQVQDRGGPCRGQPCRSSKDGERGHGYQAARLHFFYAGKAIPSTP